VLQISSLPALLLLAALTIAVMTYKRSLAQQPNNALDERERGIRDTLYLTSYRIAVSIIAGVFLAGFMAKFIAELEFSIDQIPTDTALGIAITAAVFETGKMVWNWPVVIALVWAIVPLSIGSVSLLFLLIRKGTATRVTSLLYLTPPTTAVMAWIGFDEPLTILMLIGILLTMAGVLMVNQKAKVILP
jgi:drug/metabolite transporter (DMT)-like permease